MTDGKATSLIDSLNDSVVQGLRGRSLLLTTEWSTPELEALTKVAAVFQKLDRARANLALFPNELNWALFFDASTRTKSSWAGAAARLGSAPVIVDGSSTQVSHGETAEETGAMLGMNAHSMGIRHDLILGEGNSFMKAAKKGIDDYLAATGDDRVVPFVNLQCDIDHPTQALADLCWLQERFPEGLVGRTIAVSWAYSPSYAKPLSVPQGLITLMTRFGMNVRLAHPPGYDLMDECVQAARQAAPRSGGTFTVTQNMDVAFAGADIVYPKSWGPYALMMERVEANRRKDNAAMKEIEQRALDQNRSHTDWICNEKRMAATARGSALYMHCLPADIGAEVSPGVMDTARVDVAREANKKVYVIMAALALAKEPNLKARLAGLAAKA